MSISFETLALAKRYTNSAVAEAMGGVTSIDFRFVESLPWAGDPGVIYCVPSGGSEPDLYDEYYYVNGRFERIPGARIDLTPYATKEWVTGEGYYKKPADGIPGSDLDAALRASIAKAETALQQHQSLAAYRTAQEQDEIDNTLANIKEIEVGDTEPTDPNVKLWMYQNAGQKIEIPTMEDFRNLKPATDEQVSAAVSDWLEENISGGETIAVDKSLTVEGAAADAKAVGDLKSAFDRRIISKNLWDKSKAECWKSNWKGSISNSNKNFYSGYAIAVKPNTQYTLSIQPNTLSAAFDGVIQLFSDGTFKTHNTTITSPITVTTESDVYWLAFNVRVGTDYTEEQFETVRNAVQVEEGGTATNYVAFEETYILKENNYELANAAKKADDTLDELPATINLFDYSKIIHGLYGADGAITPSGVDRYFSSPVIPVKRNLPYALKIFNVSGTEHFMRFVKFKNNAFVSYAGMGDVTEYTFTPDETYDAIAFSGDAISASDFDAVIQKIQLEQNFSPTSFTQYVGENMLKYDRYEGFNDLYWKYGGKTVFCFGDSITEGVSSGIYGKWVTEIQKYLHCITVNHGHGGDSSLTLVKRMTSLSRWDGQNYPIIDYSAADAITIQIGTNSFFGGSLADIPYTFGQQLQNMPFEYNGQTISTPDEYFANFADSSYYSHVACCIEWVKWKNPNCKIYLITPPHNCSEDGHLVGIRNYVYQVRTAMIELGQMYSVPVIDAIYNAGISAKNYMDYSFDGCHFNKLGNHLWAEYVASQMVAK